MRPTWAVTWTREIVTKGFEDEAERELVAAGFGVDYACDWCDPPVREVFPSTFGKSTEWSASLERSLPGPLTLVFTGGHYASPSVSGADSLTRTVRLESIASFGALLVGYEPPPRAGFCVTPLVRLGPSLTSAKLRLHDNQDLRFDRSRRLGMMVELGLRGWRSGLSHGGVRWIMDLSVVAHAVPGANFDNLAGQGGMGRVHAGDLPLVPWSVGVGFGLGL